MTQLLIICGYLALLLTLALYSTRLFRGTSEDYMLASHTIGPFLLLMSLFGTTMTAFALVGSTGEAFKEGIGVYGMLASSSGIVHSLCFFLIGVKLWQFGRRHGYRTQIQFFRDRLDSERIGLVLFPVLVGLVVPYLLIGVLGAGAVINGVTQGRIVVDERDENDRIVKAHVEESTFEEGTFPAFLEQGEQGFAIDGSKGGVPRHLASLAICVVVLIYVFFGGMRGTAWANAFQTTVFLALGVVTFYVIASKLGGLQEATRAVQQHHPEKLTRQNVPQLKFLTYMLIPLSIGMFPHVFQHWLTARSASAFKLPVVMHPIFILVLWLPCVLLGVWATSIIVDGKFMFPPEFPANAVLAALVGNLTSPVLAGLLTAGILAAIMSSLDSQFLCLGTMFTEDIVRRYAGRERFSERQMVLIARCFIVAIVAVTYAFSLLEPRRVFTLGVWCFSGFCGLFPLVLAAVYWRRLTKAGAYACLLATAVSWTWLFVESDYAGNTKYLFLDMLPVATIMACSTAALVVVSLVTKPPGEATLRKFFADPGEPEA